MQVVHEVRYIRSSEERQQIMRACHVEPTSGHMGMKRTIHRITERFFWKKSRNKGPEERLHTKEAERREDGSQMAWALYNRTRAG